MVAVRRQEGMSGPTDWDRELAALDAEIRSLQSAILGDPVDAERVTKYVYRLYHRASLSGSLSALSTVAVAVGKAIHQLGPAPDLFLLRAKVNFTLHRLEDTQRDLRAGAGLLESFEGRMLQADVALQEGRYETARRAYENLIEEQCTWETLVRLAHWQVVMGQDVAADQLYVEAGEQLTAKEMRTFAWLQLQRGLLDFAHGRLVGAASHYQRAGRAYSGYWLVDEHVAELLAAEGRLGEAIALLEKVVERVPRPELHQALGELCAQMGDAERGEWWYERALRAYLESVEGGEVYAFHHLSEFHARVREDAAEALKWAARDLALHENFTTEAALAWALYLDGQVDGAHRMMERALSSGVREAELFVKAARISQAAGSNGDGDRYLRLAAEINPRYERSHSSATGRNRTARPPAGKGDRRTWR